MPVPPPAHAPPPGRWGLWGRAAPGRRRPPVGAEAHRPAPAARERTDRLVAAGHRNAVGALPHLEVGLGAVPQVLRQLLAADPAQVGEPVGVQAVVGDAVLVVVEGPLAGLLALERQP